ncbi:MAG: CoA transferase [Acidimicrobiales bacterium]|nr:CoA transferase [Acidimicrobiales bacterium]
MPTSSPPLAAEVVVDLSSGIAGAYCTKLLADGGAHVVKVEAPEGDGLRKRSVSGAEISEGDDGPLFAFLSSSKHGMVADPDDSGDLAALRALLDTADVVVWSSGSRLADHAEFAPAALNESMPHVTVTSISPFGLEGPWSANAATEFTLQAWSGGIVGLGRGAADRPPVQVGGQVGEWLSGAWAAIGTLASRCRPSGDLVDVSMLEVMAMCMTYYPVSFTEMVGRPFRIGRSVITPGVESTSDGLVGVGVGTGQQWLDFCVMVEHPEWMEDRSLFANRAHLQPEIAAWMAERTTAEVLELAGALRIPHAPINNGATAGETDHLQARGALVANPRDGFLEPGPPYRFDPPLLATPTPAPRLGAAPGAAPSATDSVTSAAPDAARLPYAGVRVLDLTSFWAGPLCTHGLAMLGADVIHLESTARPDGTRLLTGLRFTEPDWWEQSGIFSGLNTGKKSVTLDLTSERGQALLRSLIDTCDVVVENYTPRVLKQIGLDVDALRSARPELIIVRMPGFGLDGPWRDNPAFAFVIEDAAGLTWLTGHPDANPVSPYCVGDSNAGTHALVGVQLALERRARTGEGALVEASMLDAALNIAAEQIVEHSAFGARLERDGNRSPTAAPQNLYLTADADEDGLRDGWVAISVATNEQWRALCEELEWAEWARDASLATADGRRVRHDEIDAALGAWCAVHRGDEVVARLWPAGVPVANVMQPHEQATLPQLKARGYFESVDHAVAGQALHSTMPFRLSGDADRVHRAAAPQLGEHNGEELTRLGLSADEIEGLETVGVIGRVPDAARRAQEKARARAAER